MDFSKRVAFLAALALLTAAALVGTADRSAAETAKTPRLTAFASCGQLLTYAKSNGNTLFAVANGKLNAVNVSDPKPSLLDTLALNVNQAHELLLHGDRLLVLSRGGYWVEPLPAIAARMVPWQPAQ